MYASSVTRQARFHRHEPSASWRLPPPLRPNARKPARTSFVGVQFGRPDADDHQNDETPFCRRSRSCLVQLLLYDVIPLIPKNAALFRGGPPFYPFAALRQGEGFQMIAPLMMGQNTLTFMGRCRDVVH